MTELEIKEQMCEVGRRVYNRGMVAANDGNFSVKLNDHEFLCRRKQRIHDTGIHL